MSQNWALVLVLVGISVSLLLWGLSRRENVYKFPFLAGVTFLGFVVPQLPAFADDPYLPQDAFAKTVFFTILCTAMCAVGWAVGKRPFPAPNWTLDERRLAWLSVLLSLIGAFFFYKISRLPPEMTSESQWTGLPVAYIFFARLLYNGFAIASLCFARRPTMLTLSVLLFDTLFYLDRILIAGRRADTAEFLLVVGIAVWFGRGLAPPRSVVLAVILMFPLAIASTGTYRSITSTQTGASTWSEISNIDLLGNFEEILEKGGPELHNAIRRIHYVDQSKDFDYGIFHWNQLVFAFIPAQIVGKEFKQQFYIQGFEGQYDREYIAVTGSTETGMADAFSSFWYFGALKFFLVAYILGRAFRTAAAGSFFYQLFYSLSITPAMLVITHQTNLIISVWVHMALLLFPFMLLAKSPPVRLSRFDRKRRSVDLEHRRPFTTDRGGTRAGS